MTYTDHPSFPARSIQHSLPAAQTLPTTAQKKTTHRINNHSTHTQTDMRKHHARFQQKFQNEPGLDSCY